MPHNSGTAPRRASRTTLDSGSCTRYQAVEVCPVVERRRLWLVAPHLGGGGINSLEVRRRARPAVAAAPDTAAADGRVGAPCAAAGPGAGRSSRGGRRPGVDPSQ